MPKLDISGTPVEFPFKPYDCQLTYIRGVLEALNGSVRVLSSDKCFFRFFKYFSISTYDEVACCTASGRRKQSTSSVPQRWLPVSTLLINDRRGSGSCDMDLVRVRPHVDLLADVVY